MELEEKLELKLAIDTELGEARAAVESVDHQMREQEKLRGELENQVMAVRGKLEKRRLPPRNQHPKSHHRRADC